MGGGGGGGGGEEEVMEKVRGRGEEGGGMRCTWCYDVTVM